MSKEQAKAIFKDGETTWEEKTMRDYTDVVYEDIDRAKDYVIEQGSNSNGNWEKWKSGKLVMWNKGSYGHDSSQSDKRTFVRFPITPKDGNNVIHIEGYGYMPNLYSVRIFDNNRTDGFMIKMKRDSGVWDTDKNLMWSAIGRWK